MPEHARPHLYSHFSLVTQALTGLAKRAIKYFSSKRKTDEMHMYELITKSTARIDSYKGNKHLGSGTGFFCVLAGDDDGSVLGLITNKHVIKDATSVKLLLTVGSGEISHHQSIELPVTTQTIFLHTNENLDVCAINISRINNNFLAQNLEIKHAFVSKEIIATKEFFEEILPLEEITMIGYPIGIMDAHNNAAVARRGVIASNPAHNYEGRPEFLIDMSCMPGSSGSPVYLANPGTYSKKDGSLIPGGRLRLLGLLWGGPERTVAGEIVAIPAPMNTKSVAITQIPINLGFVIKATELQDIFDQAQKLIE